MQEIKEKYFEGERALYGLSNTILKMLLLVKENLL
ncbi:hypothetical protein IMSAGC010_00192 [Lactobacillus johnsonii]|nr:hypothetical protein IMSAGC010_00192 [Lactobacillus johnsonii]